MALHGALSTEASQAMLCSLPSPVAMAEPPLTALMHQHAHSQPADMGAREIEATAQRHTHAPTSPAASLTTPVCQRSFLIPPGVPVKVKKGENVQIAPTNLVNMIVLVILNLSFIY